MNQTITIDQMKNEIGIALLQISKEEGLTEYAQQKVNKVAMMLIDKYPEIAQNNPLEIGRMAKDIVLNALKAAAEIALS